MKRDALAEEMRSGAMLDTAVLVSMEEFAEVLEGIMAEDLVDIPIETQKQIRRGGRYTVTRTRTGLRVLQSVNPTMVPEYVTALDRLSVAVERFALMMTVAGNGTKEAS